MFFIGYESLEAKETIGDPFSRHGIAQRRSRNAGYRPIGAVLHVRLGARPRDAPPGRHVFAGQRHRSSRSGLAAGRTPGAAGCHVSPAFRRGIRGDRRGITAAWGDAPPRSRSKSGARWRDGHGYSRTRRRRAALCSPGHPAPRIASIRKPADKTGPRQSERKRCRWRSRVL